MNDLYAILYEYNQNDKLTKRDLSKKINLSMEQLDNVIQLLEKEQYIIHNDQFYSLTDTGFRLLERMVKEEQQKKISLGNGAKEVTSAVVLLAGKARQIDCPVGILPLGEMTILDRTLQLLISQGITNIVLVAGFAYETVLSFEQKYPQVTIVRNDDYHSTGTMASLAQAKSFIKDDFLLIEGDLVFEERGLKQLLQTKDTSSVLITSIRERFDEAMVEIHDGFIYKLGKDVHQFNRIDGEMIGITKISFSFFKKMLEVYENNENPWVNYEYIMMDVSRDYRLGYIRIDDFIWGEIDEQSQIKTVTKKIYPRILHREKQDELNAVQNFVKEKLDATDKDIDLIESAGGMTNKNYKVILKGETFIVRMPGNGTERFVNRRTERDNSTIGQVLGLDVETRYFDIHTGSKISYFIHGAETLSPVTATYPKNMNFTSKLLKTLHTSGLSFTNEFNVFREIEKYETLADEMAANYYESYADLRPLVFSLENDLNQVGLERVPCHIDTVPENFVKDGDGNSYLIDWEYSGMNDPVWDLADHSIECNFSEEEEERFLKTYYQTDVISPDIRLKMLAYKICSDFVWTVWTIFKESRGDDFGSYGRDRLQRAWDNMMKYQEMRGEYEFLS